MSETRGRRQTFSDSDVIVAIQKIGDPAVKPKEIAEEIGVSDQAVRERLNTLEKDGVVTSKRFGSGKGWWINQSASCSS